ncbi:MAG: 50S ribosomal protein L16 [Brevinematales bacterium]|nr:50S ribosomal protein L16 [Brevinematales bacterium]
MPLLSPANPKWRKPHTSKLSGVATDTLLSFGEYGVIALEPTFLTDKQIETVRVLLSRQMPKGGKYWIRVFPDRSYTKRPLETRMGKGKADVDHWEAVVKRGKVIFEWIGTTEEISKKLAKSISAKIGIKVKLVKRTEII